MYVRNLRCAIRFCIRLRSSGSVISVQSFSLRLVLFFDKAADLAFLFGLSEPSYWLLRGNILFVWLIYALRGTDVDDLTAVRLLIPACSKSDLGFRGAKRRVFVPGTLLRLDAEVSTLHPGEAFSGRVLAGSLRSCRSRQKGRVPVEDMGNMEILYEQT